MTKEKLKKLEKYRDQIREKLSSEVPEKHQCRKESYTNFLLLELAKVSTTIDVIRVGPTPVSLAAK